MGRSVSCPRNAIAKVYTHVSIGGGEDAMYYDWDDFIEDLRNSIECVFGLTKHHVISHYRNEDHGIYDVHGHVIGVSEYCGLVCLWIVASDRYDTDEEDATERLARGLFIGAADTLLEKVLSEMGLKNLYKVGTFSNGEAAFQEVGA
jgi:hypothetical protein